MRTLRHIIPVIVALALVPLARAQSLTMSTLAGNAGRSSKDAVGTNALFYHPQSVAVDASSNLFVADFGNNTIRKITPAGTVSTFAGLVGNARSSDGIGSGAFFNGPASVAADTAGNIYVADSANNTIRKITPAAVVTTLAGSSIASGSTDDVGTNALFLQPLGVAVDINGFVYVADYGNHTIRKISPVGIVSTLAGTAGNYGSADGSGADAQFYQPEGIAVDTAFNVYVADTGNNVVRIITPGGDVTTLAGSSVNYGSLDGNGTNALFYQPRAVSVDSSGNVYVADFFNNTIRKITPDGTVSTLAGTAGISGYANGTGGNAKFSGPQGLAINNAGIYVADFFNNEIRLVSTAGITTTVAGSPSKANFNGTMPNVRFSGPGGMAADTGGNVYVADTENNLIRLINPSGTASTVAGSSGVSGSADGPGAGALFSAPHGLALDHSGNIFVADTGNDTIRKITPGGVVTTFAGTPGYINNLDGTGTNALFNGPQGVAVDSSGNVYVTDTFNHTIRKITSGGVVTTLAGVAGYSGTADGSTTNARFYWPQGIAVDASGNVYVTEQFNHTIRKITPAGVTTTLAGLGGFFGNVDDANSAARFFQPNGLTLDGSGNIFVVDSGNNTIRELTASGTNWISSTVAGLAGVAGSSDGSGGSVRFNYPTAIAMDGSGFIYVADTGNNTIRTTGTVINNSPSITANPSDQNVNQGGTASFSVSAAGAAPLSYQWLKNGGTIPGATISSYSLANVQSGNAGSYSVVVTNAVGSVTSANAILTVNLPPSISTQPSGTNVNQGGTALFSVGLSGTSPFAYKWSKNGAPISGATTSSYSIASVQSPDAASYSVIVTNVAGSVTSANAILTVNLPPSIASQPQPKVTAPGATATFTVGASGTASLSYRWRKNSVALSDSGNIIGSATSAVTVTNVQVADVASYSVIVTNIAGTATSTAATLVIGQPGSFTNVTFAANGSFQFQMNGTAGATYNLEVCTNFFIWSYLATFNGPSSNYSDFSPDTNHASRYYRLKLNP